MNFKNNIFIALLIVTCTHAHDILLEVKGAYFLASSGTFKSIYGKKAGIYGVDVTGKMYCDWYGFASADFLSKCGRSCGFNTPTTAHIANIGLGVKYLVPFEGGDFYVGLGALPTHLRTVDCVSSGPVITSKWGCGGIAKIGAYFNLPYSCFLDLFFDYSFVNIHFTCCPGAPTQANKVNLNGCWFGAGLGYRF